MTTLLATTQKRSRWTVLDTLAPFYFVNLVTSNVTTNFSLCLPSATSSGCQIPTAAAVTYVSMALYDDCWKLLGSSSDGHYNSGITAISDTKMSAYCWGNNSSTFPSVSSKASFYAYAFMPTTLAVNLTYTSKKQLLSTVSGAYNSISMYTNLSAAITGGAANA